MGQNEGRPLDFLDPTGSDDKDIKLQTCTIFKDKSRMNPKATQRSSGLPQFQRVSGYHLCFIFFFFEFLNFILFIFLYSRFLLVIHFIHISVYMSIPISQFITTFVSIGLRWLPGALGEGPAPTKAAEAGTLTHWVQKAEHKTSEDYS